MLKTGTLIRLEGLAALVLSIVLYVHFDGIWWVYLLFFLAPDLSMLGYLAGSRPGAVAYNLVHNTLFILLVGLAGYYLDVRLLLWAGIILLGHVGADRLLGFGLKYGTDFKDTHLQRL